MWLVEQGRLCRVESSKPGEFAAGLRAGIPIGLGYFAVALAVGLYWAQARFTPLASFAYSAFNLSSTGQFAGISIMAARGGFVELAVTTLLINVRYVLMGLSVAARLPQSVGVGWRGLIGWGITDEIYAVNIARPTLTVAHYVGSMVVPILGWSTGTVVGAVAGGIFPPSLVDAAGILLYAMFVAIVVPPFVEHRPVRVVVLLAAVVSVLVTHVDALSGLAYGWRIIIATVIAAGVGATFLPVPRENSEAQQ